MKTLIITAFALISLTACERTWKCDIRQTVKPDNGISTTVVYTEKYTGTKDEMKNFEKKGTTVDKRTGYTIYTWTSCR